MQLVLRHALQAEQGELEFLMQLQHKASRDFLLEGTLARAKSTWSQCLLAAVRVSVYRALVASAEEIRFCQREGL